MVNQERKILINTHRDLEHVVRNNNGVANAPEDEIRSNFSKQEKCIRFKPFFKLNHVGESEQN